MSKSIYDKSTRQLMKIFADSTLKPGVRFFRKEARSWFKKNYPKIKQGTIDAHITRMTTNAHSRVYYSAAADGSDDLFFQMPDGSLRLYDSTKDPTPLYDNDGKEGDTESPLDHEEESKEFAFEKDLRDFLAKNLRIIEEGLTLYEDEGITGIEYDAEGRYIDILAIDRNNDYVVIELKVSRGYDRVIGQLLRYMGWVVSNLAENGQKVRGIIIARNITDDLKIATAQVKDVELFEYELSVSIRKI